MSYNEKKKIPYKVIISVLIAMLILGTLIAFNFTRIRLMTKGYGWSEQSIILQLNDNEIERYLDAEKVSDLSSWNEYKNKKHYLEYQTYQKEHQDYSKKEVIKYIDTFYQDYYQDLKDLKYSYKQVLSLMKVAELSDFKVIVDNKYTYSQIKSYLKINGMVFEDLPKYLASNQEPITAVLTVTYPFIDANNAVGSEYEVLDPSNTLLLIKKGFVLPKDYVPADLVVPDIPIAPDNNHNKLRKDAAKALEDMNKDALKEDYHLVLNSGYRSYDEQVEIYNDYFNRYDEVTASGLVAKPGSSEHQLGLGVDLTSQSVIDKKRMVFGDTDEYKWVAKNAYKYGFILRYPKNRSDITGTANEPWHLRYVGKKAAKIIYDNNWTLEEYILKCGFDYELKKID